MHKFDYIIVGSGLAGLYAAYKASFKGNVAVITKSHIRESNSFNAQGGIAVVTAGDDALERRAYAAYRREALDTAP